MLPPSALFRHGVLRRQRRLYRLRGPATDAPLVDPLAGWRSETSHQWQLLIAVEFAAGATRLTRRMVETGDQLFSRVQVLEVASGAIRSLTGDGLAINRRQSPSSSMTKIRAPMLILCNTGDFRVPITQSFGLFRAPMDNHVPTEFYAIPAGGHFPDDPVRQMAVYQRWIDWLQRYL